MITDTTIRVHDLKPEFMPVPPVELRNDGATIRLSNNGTSIKVEGTVSDLEQFGHDFLTAVLDAKEVITNNPLPGATS